MVILYCMDTLPLELLRDIAKIDIATYRALVGICKSCGQVSDKYKLYFRFYYHPLNRNQYSQLPNDGMRRVFASYESMCLIQSAEIKCGLSKSIVPYLTLGNS